MLARVDAPALAAQPLAIEKVRSGEFRAHVRATEPFDRLAVEAIGDIAFAEQCARARFDSQRPLAPARARPLREAPQSPRGALRLPGSHRRLDQLRERPGRPPQLEILLA